MVSDTGLLVLERGVGDSVVVEGVGEVEVHRVRGERVWLTFKIAREVGVWRKEIWLKRTGVTLEDV